MSEKRDGEGEKGRREMMEERDDEN